MSLSLMNIGVRGLSAAQGSLATVSHNIANANTAGYSRQEAVLSTGLAQRTGMGFFGSGVDVSTVRRNYDQFLGGALQSIGSQAAGDRARAEALAQLDSLFADPELGVGAAMDDVFSAIGDVANRPGDMAARQALLSRLDQAAQRFNSLGAQLDALSSQADARLTHEAGLANERIGEIRRLNEQIARLQGNGHLPNDLLDQREQALMSLGALMTVRSVAADDGTLNLFTPNGAPLLVGQQQAVLSTAADPADPSRVALRLTTGATTQWLDEGALGGGSLAGTLRFRNGDLASTSAQLGRLAYSMASQLNAQQALGVDASGAPGQPLFTFGAPVSRAHSGNTSTATLGASVADATQLRASDYRVSWDGAAYQVTRLSDQHSFPAGALPATFDGLNFEPGGTPAAGDSWLVQPFEQVASSLRALPLAPAQLATGYAAMPQPGTDNTGSARIASFAMVSAGAQNTQAVAITFNDPPTTFNVTGVAGVPGGTLTNVAFTPGQAIDYNGWRLTLDGNAAAGDRFDIQRTTSPAADNRNALALGRIANLATVEGATLNEGYAGLVAHVGTRVQSGSSLADVSGRMEAETLARREGVSGVNLDEEAANLLRFQQAYQACAKIIQASQSLFDSLLSATGR